MGFAYYFWSRWNLSYLYKLFECGIFLYRDDYKKICDSKIKISIDLLNQYYNNQLELKDKFNETISYNNLFFDDNNEILKLVCESNVYGIGEVYIKYSNISSVNIDSNYYYSKVTYESNSLTGTLVNIAFNAVSNAGKSKERIKDENTYSFSPCFYFN